MLRRGLLSVAQSYAKETARHRAVLFPRSGIMIQDLGLSLLLVQIVIVLTVCRFLSLMGQAAGQPSVIFEIIGGIILGNAFLRCKTNNLFVYLEFVVVFKTQVHPVWARTRTTLGQLFLLLLCPRSSTSQATG